MATKKQRLIADLVDGDKEKEPIDKSLNAKAYRRATQQSLPTTLTPWEWEAWYAEHGVPEEHKDAALNSNDETRESASSRAGKSPSWWRRLFFSISKK